MTFIFNVSINHVALISKAKVTSRKFNKVFKLEQEYITGTRLDLMHCHRMQVFNIDSFTVFSADLASSVSMEQ